MVFETKKTAMGFQNHNWNGITTKAFGEFIYTVIVNEIKFQILSTSFQKRQ